jgi:hypothetical protein
VLHFKEIVPVDVAVILQIKKGIGWTDETKHL